MIGFLKGIFYDQLTRGLKMLDVLQSPQISKEVETDFLSRTIQMLKEITTEIENLITSGDLEIESIASNNIIKYNTFFERLLTIELFRYLVIVNYGKPEEYFKKKISRIYKEINCLQKQPIITTISNSESYYWALPTYHIIAVPAGEEKNLLNLPDLFHEMGHLIFNQYEAFLKGTIETTIEKYYAAETQMVSLEQRPEDLIDFYREKHLRWLTSWIMEFTCDMIATYLVGPAYAWTNLKITTLKSGKNKVYHDNSSHPSDEARMRAVFYMLKKMGHTTEVSQIEASWQKFLQTTSNPIQPYYDFIFPQEIIEELANTVFDGCKSIDLCVYIDQISKYGNPISKILNDAWEKLLNYPEDFKAWEMATISEIEKTVVVD